MNPYIKKKTVRPFYTILFIVIGLIVLQNQRLAVKDPENTYPKRIKRAVRLWFNPPENELQRHLIGKGIECEDSENLYNKIARATVTIKTRGSIGAGVFIGPNLIATARHVVDSGKVQVNRPEIRETDLAIPGNSIDVKSIIKVAGLDLAFITIHGRYPHWLTLENVIGRDDQLMVVGHPNVKFYSIQKARIKKKELFDSSDFVVFKDNEIFFGNSGGAIVNCSGNLVGVVSMMENYENSMLKRGIGINAKSIAGYLEELKLS